MARKWTEYEDGQILKHFDEDDMSVVCKKLPERTKVNIIRRAGVLGIRKYQVVDKHEEYMKKLKLHNPSFIEKFKMMNKYRNEKSYIYFKNEFGIMRMTPRVLLKSKKNRNYERNR